MSDIKAITYDEWMALPAATQDIMRKIGFPVPKPSLIHKAKNEPLHPLEKQRRRDHRNTCPSEYQMLLTITCLTCGVSSLEITHMATSEDGSCLVRKPIAGPLANIPIRKHSVETYSCKSCHVVLSQRSKDDLIKMILSLNDCLKYKWPDEWPEDSVTR